MVTSSRVKAADRQAVLKKLQPLLKKHYKASLPKTDRPVLELMLYAVCLENLSPQEADRCYALFHQEFPDLNEARVSQVSELERAFPGHADSEWRGYRLRNVLQFVFEKSFTFEFESLRKKTLELAIKQLAKLKQATPFLRSYVLQNAVGAHILPVDDAMKRLFIWLGLGLTNQSVDEIGDSLKSSVRKADAAAFCQLVRMAATDPKILAALPALEEMPTEGFDASTAITRLEDAINQKAPKTKSTKSVAEKSKSTVAKKSTATKSRAATKTPATKKTAKSTSRSK